jgi:uncharacterized membrane protein YraQ (UPF0718 family)
MEIFSVFNDVFLKMTWLNKTVEALVQFFFNAFNLDVESHWFSIVHFFIYDVTKIFILLIVLIFSVSYIQSFFPPERTRKILGHYKGISANVLGALMGTITPFCSCSSIPLFIGFTSAGLPIGVTFSFLISSPLVDLASIILLASMFNFRIAFAYVLVGIVLASLGGAIISNLHMESEIEAFVFKKVQKEALTLTKVSQQERLESAKLAVLDIIQKVWLYIFIGVGIGALIHNVIPQTWIEMVLGQDKWYSVLLATVVGIPIYADIFGTLPIATALLDKGVGLGTVLSFMMAVTTLSLPSLILLKKVVKPKLLMIFVLIVALGIIIIGYGMNAFAHYLM